jgi:hypothetical protein
MCADKFLFHAYLPKQIPAGFLSKTSSLKKEKSISQEDPWFLLKICLSCWIKEG